MFPDLFLPNLVLFVAAQCSAYGFLRTGLVRRGILLMLVTWVAADVALLSRFAFDDTGWLYRLALVVLQLHALIESFLFVSGRWRRRRPSQRARRERDFRAAQIHYLRDECAPARQLFHGLLRRDPWDLESMLARATVLSRTGQRSAALALFQRAKNLDRDRRFRDVIEGEVRRCAAARRAVPVRKQEPSRPPGTTGSDRGVREAGRGANPSNASRSR